MHMQQRQPAAD